LYPAGTSNTLRFAGAAEKLESMTDVSSRVPLTLAAPFSTLTVGGFRFRIERNREAGVVASEVSLDGRAPEGR
jgi:hypothetical protein